jgi:hypothetical protein
MNKKVILFFLFAFVSCADKKVQTPSALKDIGGPREQSIPYELGPENVSREFKDVTKDYGLDSLEAVHLYAVDLNNDKFTDLVTLDDFHASPKFFYFNPQKEKFELGENPFTESIKANYLIFADFDNDRVQDVILGQLNQKNEVSPNPSKVFKGFLENGKIKFKFKSQLPQGNQPAASIVPLDFNLDGKLDLFQANWFQTKDNIASVFPDFLFLGDGFNFTNISGQLEGEYDYNKSEKIFLNATPTFGATVCDVDKNGYPDILTNNSNGYFNKMWMNLDGENFKNFARESGYGGDSEGGLEARGGGNSFFSLCGDYNKDLFVDIVIGNLSKDSDPETRDKSAFLTGSTKKFPPKFIRSDFYQLDNQEKWSEGVRRGAWLDFNLDGLNDLLIMNSGFPPSSRLVYFIQEEDHAFSDKAKEMGLNLTNPSGIVTIDLNRDGKMDFITGQSKVRAGEIKPRIYAFLNQVERKNKNSMRFHLQGQKSNSFGISSTLELKTNKSYYFNEANYSYGSLPSQNEEGVYFAFNNERAEHVVVRWSYGVVDKTETLKPHIKKYNLKNIQTNGKHHEFNLCEDGRILPRSKDCF